MLTKQMRELERQADSIQQFSERKLGSITINGKEHTIFKTKDISFLFSDKTKDFQYRFSAIEILLMRNYMNTSSFLYQSKERADRLTFDIVEFAKQRFGLKGRWKNESAYSGISAYNKISNFEFSFYNNDYHYD